jgi:hypothetical protein
MKPGTLPEGAAWHEWPRLELLQVESGVSISKLRIKLAGVPCYRCPDKSVRYEPGAARAALYDQEDDEDEDDEGTGINAESLSTNTGAFAVLAMLIREQMRATAETRKERQDTIRVMQAPLELAVRMIETGNSVQAKRLEHLENVWDRMIETSEAMIAAQHSRAMADQKHADTAAMRKNGLALLDKHGPMLMSKWQLTKEAQMALQFLGSLDPKIVDVVAATGVLSAEQTELLARLRESLAKRQPPAEQQPAESESHAAQ